MKFDLFLKPKALHRLLFWFVLALCFFITAVFASENTGIGGACTAGQSRADWDAIFQCIGTAWKRAPLWLGNATDECNAAHAGLLQWTGATFQGCDGSNWVSF